MKILLIAILSVIIFLIKGVNLVSETKRIINKPDTTDIIITFKPNAVIDYPEVNIREKPTSKGKRIGSLKQGSKIYVVSQNANDGWLKIEHAPGKYAYVFATFVKFVNPQDSRLKGRIGIISRSYEVYDTATLNRLFKIKKGERVVISSIIDDKAEIISPSGKKGILPAKFVEVIG